MWYDVMWCDVMWCYVMLCLSVSDVRKSYLKCYTFHIDQSLHPKSKNLVITMNYIIIKRMVPIISISYRQTYNHLHRSIPATNKGFIRLIHPITHWYPQCIHTKFRQLSIQHSVKRCEYIWCDIKTWHNMTKYDTIEYDDILIMNASILIGNGCEYFSYMNIILLDMIFVYPGFPVDTQLTIGLFSSQGCTEGVTVWMHEQV